VNEISAQEPKKRILVIGSKLETFNTIKEFLTSETKFQLIELAATGRDGIEKAIQLKPQIVLIDISTSDMDSVNVAEQIYNTVDNVNVIMMSVANNPEWMRRALKLGVRHFLTKPINKDELRHAIHFPTR
jgi:two-component system response regulator YesN